MIYHYKVRGCDLLEEEQSYLEQQLSKLSRLFTQKYTSQDNADTVEVRVSLDKNKHHSGNVYEGKATLYYPHHPVHAEVSGENINQCSDLLFDKLRSQMAKLRRK